MAVHAHHVSSYYDISHQGGLADRHLQLTGSNGEDIHSNEEGNLGRVIRNELPGTTGHDEHVANTADNDAPEDHGPPAHFGVCDVSEEERENICEQTERLADGILCKASGQ